MREGNRPKWVMEGEKGLMGVLVVSVGVVEVNVVGAGDFVEMIEHAKPRQHGQQATRSLL